MKIRTVTLAIALVALFSVIAFAADVTGKWTAEMPGRGGQAMTTTFNFKVEGATLTGTVSGGRGGDTQISEGKVNGDEISFVVVRSFGDRQMKQIYKGKASDTEIKFTVETEGRGQPREFTAKKAQ